MENNRIDDSIVEKIKQMKVGYTFKNYNELCNFLEQKICSGASKKYQIKDWGRYFDWEKVGQKFIITDIYDKPMEYIDGRLSNRNEQYIKYVEDILLYYLYANHEDKLPIDFTAKELYKILGMINDNFYQHGNLKLGDNEISKFNINDFYKRAKQKLSSILKSALLNMKRRKIINYTEGYKICISNGNTYELHIADTKEVEMILNIEYKCLHDMGFDNIVNVFLFNKVEDYYEMCKSLANKLYGWNYYYQYYSIIVGGEAITSEIKTKENNNSAILLNQNIIKYLNNQANDRFNKNIKDQMTYQCNNCEGKIFIYPTDYIEVQEYLSDTLISIKGKD